MIQKKKSDESDESDDTKDFGKSGKSRNMYDLSSNFETLVYDNKKYKHELKTGDVIVKGTVVGKYNGDKIFFYQIIKSDSSEYSDS